MNYRRISLAVIAATLFTGGAFLALMPAASAGQSATESGALPPVELACPSQPAGASGWQPTWLLVSTQTITAYLPIVSNVQCRVSHTIDDAVNDVPLAHVDIVQSKSWLVGNQLNVQLRLRDIPPTLPFNRPGIPKHDDGGCWYFEYIWGASIDIDNNKATGGGGSDVLIMAGNCPDRWDPYVQLSLQQGIEEVAVLRWDPSCRKGEGCYWSVGSGSLSVDEVNNTLTLVGRVDGIVPNAPIGFWTFDYNPGGSMIEDISCF